ncbi:hypothetical protein B566_EDAN006378 [Ephemera danica]|nr:hypothetical protein B566_EDAN006378 [Ephemera danica]
MTKIPNLQDMYQQRISRKPTENENKMESVRSRLELNQISTKKLGQQQQRLVKPLISKISNSRDNSPGKPGNLNKPTTPVTMRHQIRPQSASSNSRKSLNLERNVTRRSLPPQDRVPINSQKRQTTRPQSCLIVEPPKRPESKHHRSLSEESLQTLSPPPPPPQRNSRLTVTKIPKVTSPNPSRATSPGIEALKYSKNTTNKGVDLKLKQSIGVKSTPVSRDPSPNNLDLKLVSNTRKIHRMQQQQQQSFQQKRPGPSYTAPSSRGSSPENSHRYLLSSIRQSSMPASPNSPLPPSRLPVPNLRYQWLSHDFG